MFVCILKARHLELVRQLKLRLWIALYRLEMDNKTILDRENRVIRDILISLIKNLRDNRFIPRCIQLSFISITLEKFERKNLTMKWICAGRIGCRSSSSSSFPAGPSLGTG